MQRVIYKIGGILLEISFPESIFLREKLKTFLPFTYCSEENSGDGSFPEKERNGSLVKVSVKPVNDADILAVAPDSVLISSFETDTGVCRFFKYSTRAQDGYYLVIEEKTNLEKGAIKVTFRKEKRDAVCEYTGKCNHGNLIFAFWMIFAFYGLQSSIAPLHSSAVVRKGKAVLFLGESGTGKSTQASLWLNHIPGTHHLNDDSPVLTIPSTGEIYAGGSPWSGKGRIYLNEQYPVSAFVRIEQSKENNIVQMNKIEAFAALYPSFPPQFIKDDRFEEIICSMISSVILSTPVYKLKCKPEKEAALLSYSEIFG